MLTRIETRIVENYRDSPIYDDINRELLVATSAYIVCMQNGSAEQQIQLAGDIITRLILFSEKYCHVPIVLEWPTEEDMHSLEHKENYTKLLMLMKAVTLLVSSIESRESILLFALRDTIVHLSNSLPKNYSLNDALGSIKETDKSLFE